MKHVLGDIHSMPFELRSSFKRGEAAVKVGVEEEWVCRQTGLKCSYVFIHVLYIELCGCVCVGF